MNRFCQLLEKYDRLVIFDTETTGIEFGRDRIIEIGAVALENGAERGNFNALVRLPAGQMLPPFITELTGITDEQLNREGVDDRTAAEGFCQPFEDGPLNNPDNPVEAVYLQLIASAKRMLYITTPYYAVEEMRQDYPRELSNALRRLQPPQEQHINLSVCRIIRQTLFINQ